MPPKSIPPSDTGAKWSPDGTKIAFLTDRELIDPDHDPSPYTIYVMDYSSGSLQRISLEALLSLSPVNCTEIDSFEWSTDGSKFVLDGGNLLNGIGACPPRSSTEIYSVNADGANLVRLTRDTNPSSSTYFMNTAPTWSPDGSQIAFASWNQNGAGGNTIDLMNSDGSNRRQIAHFAYQDRIDSMSWSPDGSKILFVRHGQEGSCENTLCNELYVVSPDGSQLTQLTHYAASYDHVRWSPDGTKILFGRWLSTPNVDNGRAVFVMNADGGNQINISNRKRGSSFVDVEADWQPLFAPANEPPPSVLGLSSGLYVANYPNPPQVQILVTRQGNLDGAVSCDYQVRTGNITSGLPSGTLSFAPGEASKAIEFSSSYFSSLRAYTVDLFNNVGNSTFIGGRLAATVIFVGQDGNAIDNSTYFVRQHYLDFLNRAPDQAGWGFWTNNIDTCVSKPNCIDVQRISTSASFFLSIEFQQTGYLVERMYKAAYGDASGTSTYGGSHTLTVPIVRLNEFLPDTQQIGQGVIVGQSGWETVLENNKQSFANQFVQRSRFTSAFPTSMTPAQFVDALNTNAGNVLSSNDRTTAINLFNGASNSSNVTARAQALRQVAENQTLVANENNRAFVLMQYFGYLRRDPNSGQDTDYTGYDFWLQKLIQFNGNYLDAEMVKAFITSIEYRQRFGPA